ncbi:hypothetical protein SRM_01528 [Salinibacter ruber M8]|uniref:Uncharacterized protein n=1 Tax=Salinibacter ruber (strain M8) TaxID=761659 RepID=D5H8U4_SALRM|nr:hypothetical protein SRM_01528 [Salinibacter ruber M8]
MSKKDLKPILRGSTPTAHSHRIDERSALTASPPRWDKSGSTDVRADGLRRGEGPARETGRRDERADALHPTSTWGTCMTVQQAGTVADVVPDPIASVPADDGRCGSPSTTRHPLSG